MTSIADLLGVKWDGTEKQEYHLTPHATKHACLKGFSLAAVRLAANEPTHTSPNLRHPGQKRHVRAGIVAVVDPITFDIITVYKDQVVTPLRPDQVGVAIAS